MLPAPAASDGLVFTEEQRFARHWWRLLLVFSALLVALSFFRVGQHPLPLGMRGLLLGLPLLLLGAFAWLRLDTRLDAAGVSYRMRPLGRQHLPWGQVRHACVREYSPLGEYGGWGIKGYSFRDYALNVAGNQGLQLELADGRRILLGTQRPAELREALARLLPTERPAPAQ